MEMDNSLKLIVYRSGVIFDSVIITTYSAVRYDQKIKEKKISHEKVVNTNSSPSQDKTKRLIRLRKKGFNAYLVSAYIELLIHFPEYRRAALNKLVEYLIYKFSDRAMVEAVFMKLRTPSKQFLDYKWNERIIKMVLERKQVEESMSWLSTIGGAYSALGDEFEHCAAMAGLISLKQLALSFRLDDPRLSSRCMLYMALSEIQRGRLKKPRNIIQHVYKFANSQKDTHLQNMCHGIWAKLKYYYKMRNRKKQSTST